MNNLKEMLASVPMRQANDRPNYLGASEAPAILGLSPWAKPFDIWARKTGAAESDFSSAATRRGHHLEGAVLDWGAEQACLDEHVRGGDFNSLPVQGPRSFAAFHPDGWGWSDNKCHLIEVKTTRSADGWESDGVPAVYAAQVRYQLACCPDFVAGAYIFCFSSFADEVFVRYIHRDEKQEARILDICDDWWSHHIEAKSPPPLDGSDSAEKWLRHIYPKQRRLLEDAVEEEAAIVGELAEVRAILKAAKSREKLLSQQLKNCIGEREGVFVESIGKVTWKWQQGRESFDSKRFKQDHPELAVKYMKRGSDIRVLRMPRGV